MKYKLMFLAVLGLFFAWPGLSRAEAVNAFNSQIHINADSSISVSELITYDFGITQHHGIFRDIPYHYQARGGNYNLRITVGSVTDENGHPYKDAVSTSGGNVHIQIGDSNTIITGVHTYVINYTVKGAINYFSDHDELYWNVTGNGWSVPISNVSAQVMLPQPVDSSKLTLTCYSGLFGSSAPCEGHSFSTNLQGQTTEVDFNQTQLAAGAGLTVVTGFPTGLVHKLTAWEKFLQIVEDNWVVALPLLVLLCMWYFWYKKGRDPLGFSTIVAQYDPPDDLTPTEVGTILDESAHNQDVSADIINLAVQGYIKITRLQNKILFLNHTDYQFDKLKDEAGLKNDIEIRLMVGLFGNKSAVLLSSLKNEFFQDLKDVKNLIYKSVVSKGYFDENPQTVRGTYAAVGIIILVLGFFLGAHLGFYFGAGIAVSGLIILIFSKFMPHRTPKGAEARQYILGLKLYLSVVEKERLKFFNAPDKTPERFEKLLPYAMVLGVEQEWAKQFEGLYTQPPQWYSDPAGGAFNTYFFVSSLHSFSAATNATMSSQPRSSAAGGGSGFGGGFSGGGFGGGGGGSW